MLNENLIKMIKKGKHQQGFYNMFRDKSNQLIINFFGRSAKGKLTEAQKVTAIQAFTGKKNIKVLAITAKLMGVDINKEIDNAQRAIAGLMEENDLIVCIPSKESPKFFKGEKSKNTPLGKNLKPFDLRL
jgi:vacuolar-type H+-ATPase subunit F/Vma7